MNQHGCVRRVVGWGAALALLLGACSADLKLPSGIQVVCGDGKGCPVGFVCSPAVQRCVPAGERDSDPPVVVAGSARIEPAVAGRDTVVRVEMQVSEPLAFPPAVHLQALDEPALTPVGQEGDTYTFTYQATGEEPEEAVALTADLVDLTGNVVNDTVLDSVTFDFTRPLVSGLELESPSWLTRGATGYARFTLSELPTDPPRVVLEGTERELSPEPGVQPPEYRYAFPVGDDDQEGEYGVLVSVEDDAGNLAMERTLDRFVLDFEPPALVGEPKVLTPAVPPGTVLGIALAVSEELSTDPTVVLQRADGLRIDVTSVQQVGLHYVFARLAPAEEGQYDIHVAGYRDRAGNPGAPWSAQGALLVDGKRPRLTAGPFLNALRGAYRVGQWPEVTFQVDESLGAPPLVVLGTEPPLPLPDCQENLGLRYVCRTTGVLTGEEGEGPFALGIIIEDAAGNTGIGRALVTLDFQPPDPVVSIVPLFANTDDVVQVTVDVAEALAPGTLVLETRLLPDGGWGPFSAPRQSGLSYTWSRSVTSGLATGEHAFRISMEDLAGNRVHERELAQRVTVDADTPRIEEAHVLDDRFLRGGETLQVVLTISETLERAPAVFLGTDAIPMQPDPGRVVWRGSWDCPDDGTRDGLYGFTVRMEDRAGNSVVDRVTLGQVTIDSSAPMLAGTPFFTREDDPFDRARVEDSLNEIRAKAGSAVWVRFAISEPAGDTPTVRVEGGPAGPAADLRGGMFFELAVTPQEGLPPAGAALVTADVVDRAGNFATLDLGTIHCDYGRPNPPAPAAPGLLELVRAPWGGAYTQGEPLVQVRSCPAPPEQWTVCPVSLDPPPDDPPDPPEQDPWTPCPDEVAPTLEAWTLVRVYGATHDVQPPGCGGPLLAEAQADGAGSACVPLPFDRSGVCVTQTDRAGNESERVLVEDVELVATLGGKVQGSTEENPNVLLSMTSFDPLRLDQAPAATEPDRDVLRAVAEEAAGLVGRVAGQRPWVQVEPSVLFPMALFGQKMAHDRGRGRTVYLDGHETWEWAGDSWHYVQPALRPRPRYEPALVYDAARGRVLLFGGTTGATAQEEDESDYSDELWEYDGQTWREIVPDGDQDWPPPRTGPSLAYDEARGRAVLFGGFVDRGFAAEPLNDTWEWDGATWHPFFPDPKPMELFGHSIVYDAARGEVLLYGGCSEAVANPLGDDRICVATRWGTWAWDGTRWEERVPDGPRPPPRLYHGMVYDRREERVLMFGGYDAWVDRPPYEEPQEGDILAFEEEILPFVVVRGYVRLLGDLWEWDGETWTELDPPGERPPRRANPGFAYDEARGQVVLTGGRCGLLDACDDTWTWDGRQWHRVTGEVPESRRKHGLVPDPGGALLFGGIGVTTDLHAEQPLLADTWLWRRPVWRRAAEGEAAPSARAGHELVHLGPDGQALLFGGCSRVDDQGSCLQVLGDTWRWTGSAWEPVPPAGDVPPPRWRHALASMGEGGPVLLFGGEIDSDEDGAPDQVEDDTWLWEDGVWSRPDVAGNPPPARKGHHIAWEPISNRVVLFGGTTGPNAYVDDTWVWDGAGWLFQNQGGDDRPERRAGHRLVHDPVRNRSLLLWGRWRAVGDTASVGSLHAWAGRTWSEVTPQVELAPIVRRDYGAVYDPARGGLVVFGGQIVQFLVDETWEWDLDPDLRPATQLVVDLDFPGADGAELTGIAVRARAGGRGYTLCDERGDDGDAVGDAVDGAELLAWDAWAGAWVSQETNAAAPDAPDALTWDPEGPEAARRLLLQRDHELHLAVLPASGSGNGPSLAELSLDYLEVRVRYRW